MRPTTWLVVPFAFALSVLGLVSILTAALGDFSPVGLSAIHVAAGVAVAAACADHVAWPVARWLRWAYLAAVLTAGVLLDGVRVPLVVALLLGVPVLLSLVRAYVVERRRTRSDHTSGWSS
ncbi:hypothetical protein [Actinosynnema sp. NPDC020468]|uniref:hypothetical protein n=1 Tax=Actinosynnema sp. NPDC020468 TaxID=3154488 RepID=UPI00340A75E1